MKKFNSEEIKKFVSKPLFDEKVILNKDPSWPKISIVTPSYNQAEFLEETIISVLNQNYPNLEYIIIDGGSTDESVEIIKKYEKYISYWVSEEDKGQAHALNKGFRFSSGELVGWQNSDDFYLPNAFIKVGQVFSTHIADIYFGHKYNVDKRGNIIRPMYYTKYSMLSNIYEGIQLANQSSFWCRRLFKLIGYLDDNFHYALDSEFFLRMGLNRCKFHLIDEFLGCLRMHESTKSSKNKNLWMIEHNQIIKKHNILKKGEWLNRSLSILHRTYCHLRLGHYKYVFYGLLRRMKIANLKNNF
ncbi:MAG: glycosyltransferase family 2 protein [Candidatus Helarchaeota archaeon]